MKEMVMGSDIVFAESLNFVFAERPKPVQIFDGQVIRQDEKEAIILGRDL